MEEKLINIFKNVFNMTSDEELMNLQFNQGNWDSMNHLNLIILLEQTFSITIMPDDVLLLEDFNSTKNLLRDFYLNE